MLQQRAKQLGEALLHAPVPAGLHERRHIDQRVHAYGLVSRASVSIALEQLVCLKPATPLLGVRMARKRKRSWTADALCLPRHRCHMEGISARTTRHFYRAFFCKRLSSRTAGPLENLLCQSRLALSRTCCLSSVQRLRNPSSGFRSSARRSLPAPVRIDEFRWKPDQVPLYGSSGRADSPCFGQTDRIHDSEPDLWEWQPVSVPGAVPQPVVSFQPRLLLQELVLALTLHPILAGPLAEVPHQIRLALPQWVAHTKCAIIMFQATVNY